MSTIDIYETDRPSYNGALVGEVLTMLYDAGIANMKNGPIGKRCSTCAFKAGTMANQSERITLEALDCTIGLYDAAFGCHSGIKEGEIPKTICQGYIVAKLAPFKVTKEAISTLVKKLKNVVDKDTIKDAFDSWFIEQYGGSTVEIDFYEVNKAYSDRE